MPSDLETVKAMLAAGEKATQEVWKARVRQIGVDDAKCVDPSEFLQCHIGRTQDSDFEYDEDDDLAENLITGVHPDEHPMFRGSFLCTDAAFMALAANARPALSRFVARAEKLMIAAKRVLLAHNGDDAIDEDDAVQLTRIALQALDDALEDALETPDA